MTLALFILVAGFFAVYILLPYFEQNYRRKRIEFGESELENLTHRKSQVLEALRDLEYDHKMRKVSDQDYSQLKENLTQQAVDVMKKMDSVEKGSDRDESASQTDEQAHQRT